MKQSFSFIFSYFCCFPRIFCEFFHRQLLSALVDVSQYTYCKYYTDILLYYPKVGGWWCVRVSVCTFFPVQLCYVLFHFFIIIIVIIFQLVLSFLPRSNTYIRVHSIYPIASGKTNNMQYAIQNLSVQESKNIVNIRNATRT